MKRAWLGSILILLVAIFSMATMLSAKDIDLNISGTEFAVQVLDRYGKPVTVSYQGAWNSHDNRALHEIPVFLQQAFLQSEDKRFYEHGGVDWPARLSAVWQNIRHGRSVRGASTITEQVVRIVHPRPRNIWSKYIEGFEAAALEEQYSKNEIFEFYLNQLPYGANRRGIVQAARYYFGRDLQTLTHREMLALTVLARAPSAYDLYRHPDKTVKAIDRLASQVATGPLLEQIMQQTIITSPPTSLVEARHFARYVRAQPGVSKNQIHTTLDSGVQSMVQQILDQRIASLSFKNVTNGAAIVADHTTGEILSWVVAGAGQDDVDAHDIDAVLVPRQPGSVMKPFLYARALDKGWHAGMFLDDSPLSEAVGNGLHRFRNYSRHYYGPISIREALGNSLNIPALLTIRYVGIADYLTVLHQLGFSSLDRGSDIYDEGLALGNGEVTLLEIVSAYNALANKGSSRSLRYLTDDPAPAKQQQVFSPEAASVIGNILSDPWARRQEFGQGSILNLPLQTAVKTGTSTDYRDAWVVGYNDRYIVGIWMGNLDHSPMDGVTGSTGPALAMRGIFSQLNKNRDTKKLYLSPSLVKKDVCIRPGTDCATRPEWMRIDDVVEEADVVNKLEMVRPTQGLQMAYDPRIPAEYQKFRFEIKGLDQESRVVWILNDKLLGETKGGVYLWPVERGRYALKTQISQESGVVESLNTVNFEVK